MYPQELRYTPEHEWIRLDGNRGVIGITAFAQDQLGDVVYVELPRIGAEIEQSKTFGVVESVKTASDLFAPVSGKVVAINEELGDNPEWVNQDPYGKAWMIAVELSDLAQLSSLLTAEQYEASLPT